MGGWVFGLVCAYVRGWMDRLMDSWLNGCLGGEGPTVRV